MIEIWNFFYYRDLHKSNFLTNFRWFPQVPTIMSQGNFLCSFWKLRCHDCRRLPCTCHFWPRLEPLRVKAIKNMQKLIKKSAINLLQARDFELAIIGLINLTLAPRPPRHDDKTSDYKTLTLEQSILILDLNSPTLFESHPKYRSLWSKNEKYPKRTETLKMWNFKKCPGPKCDLD